MIIISDTTPIISLLKINKLDLLEKSFGEVLIPDAVYKELTADSRFIAEAKGRTVSGQMGITIMGTIGLLLSAYEDKFITAEETRTCIDDLQRSGRHIGKQHYQMLLDRLQQ